MKTWEALDDIAVTQGLLQITAPSCDWTFKMPNFDYVHEELPKPHVTLKLLWRNALNNDTKTVLFLKEGHFFNTGSIISGG
jgi:hypothetical protein